MARSMRFRKAGRAVAAVGVVGVLGLGTACGGGGGDEGAVTVEVGDQNRSPADALVRASDATSAVETGRMKVSYALSGTADGQSFDGTMTAEGSFADFGRQAELTLDMTPLLSSLSEIAGDLGEDVPDSLVIEEIVTDGVVYLRMDIDPPQQGMDFDGWIRMDLSQFTGGQDSGTGGMFGAMGGAGGLTSGPGGYLDSLKGAGADVEEAGEDEIDGAHVTVYRGTIDPEAAVAAAAPEKADEVEEALRQSGMTEPLPFTVWVDDDGMVRRMKMGIEMNIAGDSIRMDMDIELYDFGAPVTITPPPADEVTDLDSSFGPGSSPFTGGRATDGEA